MIKRGVYIGFEGGEHSGKSSQVLRVAERLGARAVREPGGTPSGIHLRQLLLDPNIELSTRAEVLLMAADRAILAETVIEPTLAAGNHVISDRTWYSSLAYQGVLGELPVDIRTINQYAMGHLINPDLTILLDGDPNILHARSENTGDRYERLTIAFHVKLRRTFLQIASMYDIVVVNAENDQASVSDQVDQAIFDRLGL